MNFIKRLLLVFTHGEEIDEVLKEKRWERKQREHELRKDQLDLCERHQQRSPGTYHSEHNCDFCRLLKEGHR